MCSACSSSCPTHRKVLARRNAAGGSKGVAVVPVTTRNGGPAGCRRIPSPTPSPSSSAGGGVEDADPIFVLRWAAGRRRYYIAAARTDSSGEGAWTVRSTPNHRRRLPRFRAVSRFPLALLPLLSHVDALRWFSLSPRCLTSSGRDRYRQATHPLLHLTGGKAQNYGNAVQQGTSGACLGTAASDPAGLRRLVAAAGSGRGNRCSAEERCARRCVWPPSLAAFTEFDADQARDTQSTPAGR